MSEDEYNDLVYMAGEWRKLFESRWGKIGLDALRGSIAQMELGEPHHMHYKAGRIQGMRDMLELLVALARPPALPIEERLNDDRLEPKPRED